MMKPYIALRVAPAAATLGLAVPAYASDVEAIIQVRIDHAPSGTSATVPAAGGYRLSLRPHHARAALPDGSLILFDFDKKTVSTVDPKAKTFFQQSLGDFISFGDKLDRPLSNRYSTKETTKFSVVTGQESRTVCGLEVQPCDLTIENVLNRQSLTGGYRGGFGGGRRRGGFPGGGDPGGGGTYPGEPPAGTGAAQPSSMGCSISGEMWVSAKAARAG